MIRLATKEDFETIDFPNWMGKLDYNLMEDHEVYCYEEGGRVLIMGGLFPIRKHVAEAWIVASENIKNKLFVAKNIQIFLWALMEKYDLFRVQAHTISCKNQGKKLLNWLGFEHEGVCKSYDGFNDFDRYALVIKWE